MKSIAKLLAVPAGLFVWLAGAQAQAADIWSGDTRITQLYPDSTGMNFVTTYANTSLSTCDSGSRWAFSTSTSNYQVMVATLVAAFVAGKTVNLNITVNAAQCAGVVNRFIVKE